MRVECVETSAEAGRDSGTRKGSGANCAVSTGSIIAPAAALGKGLDALVVGQFAPGLFFSASAASKSPIRSAVDQRREVTPAAIAGVTLSV